MHTANEKQRRSDCQKKHTTNTQTHTHRHTYIDNKSNRKRSVSINGNRDQANEQTTKTEIVMITNENPTIPFAFNRNVQRQPPK